MKCYKTKVNKFQINGKFIKMNNCLMDDICTILKNSININKVNILS